MHMLKAYKDKRPNTTSQSSSKNKKLTLKLQEGENGTNMGRNQQNRHQENHTKNQQNRKLFL
jgi:hypothetical protein